MPFSIGRKAAGYFWASLSDFFLNMLFNNSFAEHIVL
ncbi:hypothetical protein Runsl_3629 [Runella slithyformis DSM 19594]|uniref:Uncharacterized protein n=1 Tax=Runella slithyformis (strain ATCC 29530 / DSM 19594 / LMG 11500 / NCIMB 11436 / LSU 4) TaxID=761193 RepID=A0A7U3ZML9_RUNSL|nr:hypothetical protein Runsl_3629 [Runella slithyformis DSM 19594]